MHSISPQWLLPSFPPNQEAYYLTVCLLLCPFFLIFYFFSEASCYPALPASSQRLLSIPSTTQDVQELCMDRANPSAALTDLRSTGTPLCSPPKASHPTDVPTVISRPFKYFLLYVFKYRTILIYLPLS